MLSVYEITCTYAQGTLEGMVYFRNLPLVSTLFHEISYAEIYNISRNSADSGMKETSWVRPSGNFLARSLFDLG
jgi:hypothetical protein